MASGESFFFPILSSLFDQFSLGLFLAMDMKAHTTLMPNDSRSKRMWKCCGALNCIFFFQPCLSRQKKKQVSGQSAY